MTKKEQQDIARSLYKTLQPMKISRDDKFKIYYAMVSGLAMAEGFSEDYLLGYDIVMDDALRKYKEWNRNKLIASA
jgi:hypothetical protein